jgi:hypothetical protein
MLRRSNFGEVDSYKTRSVSMKKIIVAVVVHLSLFTMMPISQAQKGAWGVVRGLPAGMTVHIKTQDGQSAKCKVSAVTFDSITCSRSGKGNDVVFSKVDILTVKKRHGIWSALGGMAAGTVLGAVLGFFDIGKYSSVSPGAEVLLGMATGAVVGFLIDAWSETLYRAP